MRATAGPAAVDSRDPAARGGDDRTARISGWFSLLFVGLSVALAGAGCGDLDDGVGVHEFPLRAYCSAHVRGVGDRDVETDYLPHVVQCENGGADFEALKVQAVTARSYLYYKLETSGDVADGTGDQVYSCGRNPTADQIRAVEETSGVFLSYEGVTVAAFYVAGAHGTPPECSGDGSDPTGTEHWVTYNEGRSGDDLEQTALGWVNSGNLRNRGCASQNGADCLAQGGRDYREILRFYYGEDITIEQANGDCVLALPDEGGGGGGDADADGDADVPGGDGDADGDADVAPGGGDADGDTDIDGDSDLDADADGDWGPDANPGFGHVDARPSGGLRQAGCTVAPVAPAPASTSASWMLVALGAVLARRRRP